MHKFLPDGSVQTLNSIVPIQLTLDAPLLLMGWRNLTGAVEQVYQQDYGVMISIEKMDIKPAIPLEAVDDLYILYTITPIKYTVIGSVDEDGEVIAFSLQNFVKFDYSGENNG